MTTYDATTRSPGSDPGRRSIGKVVFASLIGTATEWYDFFLFGSAAALVFGEVFFGEIGGTDRHALRLHDLRARASSPAPSAAWSSATSVTGSAARRCWSSRC